MVSALSIKLFLPLCILCFLLSSHAAAFGSGQVSASSNLKGYMARHGDIENILVALPMSYATGALFGAKNAKLVYFGNWLRDFSQIIDTGALAQVPKALLHIIIAILGLLEFGYATREYEIEGDVLGVYRPEEHIDNPKGYPANAQTLDPGLRGPLRQIELEIDPKTGMTNYIANESLSIATSSGYIRDQLRLAIKHGRDGSKEENKHVAMRHLGAALHTLEDFSAHTNYVELCLLLIGKTNPSQAKLKTVFSHVGEAATVDTKKGPAPPLISGTFGPLDAFESILGEINDQRAGGKLGDLGFLDDRMGSSNESFIGNIITSLIQDNLPPEIVNKLNTLKEFKPTGGAASLDWYGAIKDPDLLWQQIKPVIEIHDDIHRWIDDIQILPKSVVELVAKISNAADTLLFQQLPPYLKPLIRSMREFLEEQRKSLAEQEKKSAKHPEADVFAPQSTATNPTHTMLAKDHFDCILNNPAGQVAAVVTSFATRAVVTCWDDSSVDAENAIRNILEVLHHPFNASESSELQRNMFRCVKDWWNFKDDSMRSYLLRRLTKESIEQGTNKLLIKQPSDYFLKPLSPGISDKPAFTIIAENLVEAQAAGELAMSKKELDVVVETLRADPTPEQPNPIDAALMAIGLPVETIFKNVGVQEIVALPTIGDMTRTTIVDALLPKISSGT